MILLTQRERDVIAAWIVDRAEQYSQGSASCAALYELVRPIREGEPEKAHAHGELDDILKRWETS